MYGLRWTANRSNAKRRRKANKALAASTIPDQLSQLRKFRLKGRGCAGAVASGIAAIIYRRLEKSPRNNRGIADPRSKIAIESAAQKRRCTAALQKRFVQNLARLFFEGANVCDQRLDVGIGKFAPERFHRLLAACFYAFLNRSRRFRVTKRRLNLGVAIIFHTQFLAHHGAAAAVLTMAGGAMPAP